MKTQHPDFEGILTFTVTVWGVVFFVSCLVLALTGCGGPPQSISLDPLFSADQVAAIQDARDQWCETNGWCPIWSWDGEAHIVLQSGYANMGHVDGSYAFTHEATDTVYVSAEKAVASPDMFWVALAHEMGHLQGIAHHGTPGCTMFWYQDKPVYQLECEQ